MPQFSRIVPMDEDQPPKTSKIYTPDISVTLITFATPRRRKTPSPSPTQHQSDARSSHLRREPADQKTITLAGGQTLRVEVEVKT